MLKASVTTKIIYRYDSKLLPDVVLKRRYKRFLADVSTHIRTSVYM